MSLSDEPLSSSAIKFVPWPPSWEEGLTSGGIRPSASVLTPQRPQFTETERELIHRGVNLVVGVKEPRIFEQPPPQDTLLDPASTRATTHCAVRRVRASNDVIVLQTERDNTILLEAERQTSQNSKHLWKITSPLCELGDCTIIANPKRSVFYLLRDGCEEVAISYRKPPSTAPFKYFDVIIPALQRDSGKRTQVRFDGKNSYLASQFGQDKVAADVVKLSVREPESKEGRWVLLFNGRVKKPSTKNFIVVLPSQPTREILLCGKASEQQFVFDLNWPLSVLQGFGVHLTMFSEPKPN
jgi:hypothetical protein